MPNKPKSLPFKLPSLWGMTISIVLLFVGYGLAFFWIPDRGTFGDMYGAFNALFSALAYVVVVYAIFLQREDIRLQREEVELTRRELEGQKVQMQAQTETMRRQRFEHTFFALLQLYTELVRAMDLKQDHIKQVVRGRDCFKVFCEVLEQAYREVKDNQSRQDEHAILLEAWRMFTHQYQSLVGHYFRTLYNIIKFVKHSDLNDEAQRVYVSLLRAQLSADEVQLLFYNCLGPRGREKFKPLVEEFALLEDITDAMLLDATHREYYAPAAFSD